MVFFVIAIVAVLRRCPRLVGCLPWLLIHLVGIGVGPGEPPESPRQPRQGPAGRWGRRGGGLEGVEVGILQVTAQHLSDALKPAPEAVRPSADAPVLSS